MVGTRGDGAIHIAFDAPPEAREYAIYGPYVPLAAGAYDIAIDLDPGASAVEGAHVDAVAESGTLNLGGRTVPASEFAAGTIRYTIELKRPTLGVETRLLVPGGFRGAIRRVTITERSRES